MTNCPALNYRAGRFAHRLFPSDTTVFFKAVHADLNALHLSELSEILLQDHIFRAGFIGGVQSALNVHNAGADLAEILSFVGAAEIVPSDGDIGILYGPQVHREIGSLGEILLMDHPQPVSYMPDDFYRIGPAPHGPKGVHFKIHILGIRVLQNMIEDGFAVDGLKFMVVIVIEEFHAVAGEDFSHPVIILAAPHQGVIVGEKIGGLADILVANLAMILDDSGQGGFIDGAEVAAAGCCWGIFKKVLNRTLTK